MVGSKARGIFVLKKANISTYSKEIVQKGSSTKIDFAPRWRWGSQYGRGDSTRPQMKTWTSKKECCTSGERRKWW
jgi:hypothetical protein